MEHSSKSRSAARIAVVDADSGMSGGNRYASEVARALSERFDVKYVFVSPPQTGRLRNLRWLYRIGQMSSDFDLAIRSWTSMLAKPARTRELTIGLFHHDPLRGGRGVYRLEKALFGWILYQCLRRSRAVVAVSDYWRSFLEAKGIRNVKVIHNAFDASTFEAVRSASELELRSFRARLNLDDRPVVYLGKCQPLKGVLEAHEVLKEKIEWQLVTSGPRRINLPVPNFNLEYKSYLMLLRISSVVLAMSQFDEGWNRIAHEAMLCGTPVIGSGRGGMAELLGGGGQLICERFADLPAAIEHSLSNRERLSASGYLYARQFTLDKFRRAWVSLVESIFNAH